MTAQTLTQKLHALHEDYAWQINAAVGRGEDDLVPQLVATYVDEALALITSEAQPA